jgi:multidrug efflux pump subunit AcrA (membrane-fusion protein)
MVAAKSFAPIVAPRMRGRESSTFQMVLQKLAPAGSQVKKGDVIAEFDRQWQLQRIDDQQAQVVQAEANITKRKAELAVVRQATLQTLRVAKAEMEKARLDLKTSEVRSAIDAEKLKLVSEETAARYKQLEAEIPLMDQSHAAEIKALEYRRDREKIDRERAERNAERMIVRAPMDGIVVMQTTFRGGQPGTVQEGDQVYPGSLFMQVVDPSTMIVNATVNQSGSHDLRLGQRAEIRLDAYPGQSWPGRLYSIGAMAATSSYGFRGGSRAEYVRQIPVRFQIDGRDPRIIPDLSASATVLLAEEKDVLLVPREALERRNGEAYARVRRPDGGWERRRVEAGLANGTHVVVRAGLMEGDEIALEL